MTFRIISRLDIKDDKLVKGINLEGLKIIGDPVKYSQIYYNDNIDEIILHDVVASLYNRNNLSSLLKKLAKNIFIPLCVGGGIRCLNDINNCLINGADKVSINTAAFKNKNFLSEAVREFGSSTISINIETLKIEDNFYTFMNNGRTPSNIILDEWIKKVQDYGVGEIILTSIQKEGLQKGFDWELLEQIDHKIKIPYLIHGGAGKPDDILYVKKNFKSSGVIISSILHYYYYVNVSKNLWDHDFSKQKKFYKVSEIKNFLSDNNIEVKI